MNQKTVWITGASRGIGRACAYLFASRGYHVYINCAHSLDALKQVHTALETSFPGCSTCITGDVGNPAEVKAMYEKIQTRSHGLDVLVNNAGAAHMGLITDLSDEEWNRILSVNLSSVFYCTKAALPDMIHRKSGHIINISSMWGTAGASCEAAYSAAKSGVHGFTRALAKELAPSGISVNAVACGVIDTAMNAMLSPEDLSLLTEEIPAGRLGTPDEVAALVYSIAESSVYMTGQIIGIDGGFL